MKQIFAILASMALSPVALAAEPTSDDVYRCFSAYYSTAQAADLLVMTQQANWTNLATADLDARRYTVAASLGYASAIAAEVYANNAAMVLLNSLLTGAPTHAAVARVAICDEVFGFSPAIEPVTEVAQRMVRLQKAALAVPPGAIVACDRAYRAGAATPEASQSFVEVLWSGAKEADFAQRVRALEDQADIVGAYDNIPIAEASRDEAELWKERLPAALASQDTETQNAFWTEVAGCDAMFEIAEPVEATALLDPNPSHYECAAYYTALRALYPQQSQGFNYFHERAMNAARFVRLVGTPSSDQQIMDEIAAQARSEFELYNMASGNPNYLTILYTFTNVEVCDRQYGLPPTPVPEEVSRAVKQAN